MYQQQPPLIWTFKNIEWLINNEGYYVVYANEQWFVWDGLLLCGVPYKA